MQRSEEMFRRQDESSDGAMVHRQFVAHWIVALADSATRWITGQVLGVDGGLAAT